MMFNWAPPTFPVGARRAPIRPALSRMARSPQPLQRILATDPTLAAWDRPPRPRGRARRCIVRRHLPRPLGGAHSRRRRARTELNLELAADAGAIAAIVRQRSAELLAALQREGWEFTGIRVRVQVRSRAGADPRNHLQIRWIGASLRPLSALARDLPAGPLKAALERFLRRVG